MSAVINTQPNAEQKKDTQPESVKLTVHMWVSVVVLQLIHVGLNVLMTVLDSSALEAAARQAAEEQGMEDVSEQMMLSGVIGSVVIMVLIQLLILALLTWAVRVIHQRTKHADTGRRMWIIFSIYFAFQAGTVFALSPAGSDVPEFLFLVDGSIQILSGVAAVMGVIFAGKEDTLSWVKPDDEKKPTSPTTT